MTGTATTAAGSISLLNIALTATVAGAIIAGIVGLVGVIISLSKALREAGENAGKMSDQLTSMRKEYRSIDEYKSRLGELKTQADGTQEALDKFYEIREEIRNKYPDMADKVGNETVAIRDLDGAYQNLIDTLSNYQTELLKTTQKEAQGRAYEARMSISSILGGANRGIDTSDQEIYSSMWYDLHNHDIVPSLDGIEMPTSRAAVKRLRQWIDGMTAEQQALGENGIIKEMEVWMRNAASYFGYEDVYDFKKYVSGLDLENSSNMYPDND